MNTVNIGLLSVGLNTYWSQFDGLKERLLQYQNVISERMASNGVEVITTGVIDTVQKADEAVQLLKEKNVELIFVFVSTYSLSSTILPIVRQVKAQYIILNIQPSAAIDYDYLNALGNRGQMTGEWLAYCQACAVPELASVLNRVGIRYEIITGHLADADVWKEISDWIDAFRVVVGMRKNRMGVLGHYYGGMLDVYTDTTLQSVAFGTHIEQLEMCELKHYRDEATTEEVQRKLDEFQAVFDVDSTCESDELERAARTSVALDKLVAAHELGSMAYYYEGHAGNDYENIVTSVIAGNTLLTGKEIPVAGECEVKNVQAMKIMSLLGAGGSFSEPYAMDFNDDIILWGHDGSAHYAMADGKVQLVPLPLYHGKPGKGLSIQMHVKPGDVTLLSVCEGKEGVFLLVAEGQSVEGVTLHIGNTNSRYKFPISAKNFINAWSKAGPSHHCAIGVGHVAAKIQKIAFMLSLPFMRVC